MAAEGTNVRIFLRSVYPFSSVDIHKHLLKYFDCGGFEVFKEVKEEDYTYVEVLLISKSKAKVAQKKLRLLYPPVEVSFHDFKVCLPTKDVKRFVSHVSGQSKLYLERHKEKTNLLLRLRSSSRSVESIEARIVELQEQESEFASYTHSLMQYVEAQYPRALNNDTLSLLWKRFARECAYLYRALPIYAKRGDIVDCIRNNQVVVIVGETGCGKSTQLVQYLYDAGFSQNGTIVCAEPRKIAAISLSKRVQEEMCSGQDKIVDCKLGNYTSHQSPILFTTDHILLNEVVEDRYYSRYSCVIIDEAHERTLHTDILLAFLKQCCEHRKDLRVIITSATINPQLFVEYFGQCPVLSVSGRTFPIDVIWNPLNTASSDSITDRDYVQDAIAVTKKVHSTEGPGGILLFLSSPGEIEQCCQVLEEDNLQDVMILPLHGKLQPDDQQRVFGTYQGKRKIVVATNVAETSVTIPDIKYVVDTGVAKTPHFDPVRNLNVLKVCTISQSSAEQRKGRAGRVSEGKCFRLYSEEMYKDMPKQGTSEILRVQLAHIVLKLIEFGVSDPMAFDFLEKPDLLALQTALKSLYFLGAIDGEGLTDLGYKLATLPFDPYLGRILFDGMELGVGLEAAICISISTLAGSVFFRAGSDEVKAASDLAKIPFCSPAGDQVTGLNVYLHWVAIEKSCRNAWCVQNFINAKSMRIVEQMVKDVRAILYHQLSIQLPKASSKIGDIETIISKLYFRSFIDNLAVYLGHERAGYINPIIPGEAFQLFKGSSLCQLNIIPKYLAYEKTLKTHQSYVLQALPVKEEWVREAIEEGVLLYDPAVECKPYMVVSIDIHNMGQNVFTTTISKAIKSLHRETQLICENTPIALHPIPEELVLKVYTQPKYHDAVKAHIESRVKEKQDAIRNESLEIGVTKEDDDVRVVLGLGGEIQFVLMPLQFRRVVLQGPTRGSWEVEAQKVLEKIGKIERKAVKTHDDKKKMYVTFQDPSDADKALQSRSLLPDKVTIKSQNSSDSNHSAGSQMFRIMLEWERRKRLPFGFLNFSSIEGYNFALRILSPQRVHIGQAELTFRASKDKNTNVYIKINGSYSDLTHISIKDTLVPLLGDFTDFTVSFGFEKAAEITSSQLEALKNTLSRTVAKYATEGQFTVTIYEPKIQHTMFRACVDFVNPNDGQRALSHLSSDFIGGKLLQVTLSLSSFVRYRNNVYNVVKTDLLDVVQFLQQKYKGVTIKDRTDTYADCHSLEVRSNDMNSFAIVKAAIQAVLQPDVISCQSSAISCQYIKTKVFTDFLATVQHSTSTFIDIHLRTMSLKLYGTVLNRSKALALVNEHLENLKITGIDLYDIKLKSPESPPGIMKCLIERFGPCLKDITTVAGVQQALLEPCKHTLKLLCTKEGYENIQHVIRGFNQVLPSQPENVKDCCACFSPVENGEGMVMECCGHWYHSDCIKMQLSSGAAVFPLKCAADNCSSQFTICDIQNAAQNSVVTIRDVMELSLKQFLMANQDKARSCPSPNCSMIYAVSNDGRRFVCSQCGIHLCTTCHVQFHDGMTCAMYQSASKGDEGIQRWLQERQNERKRCPKCKIPIEKLEGCNHVSCGCQAHICWVCLQYFQTSGECYGHLSSVHGSFI